MTVLEASDILRRSIMDIPVADWLSLALRWLHVIFGAAWIGTSFYFNWLNNHIRPVASGPPPDGVDGELWSVHGGKFYQVVRYDVAPPKLPKTLHWFKYEAYFTWLSGFALLSVVYYLEPSAYLVDSRVRAMDEALAIALGVGTLILGWLGYHFLCKSALGKRPVALATVGVALMTAVAFGLTQVFGGRAAYIHVGALMGTLMAGNVWFVIIPNQKVAVTALTDGREPEAWLGEQGAQRSLHNNYFTLPVLFIMVSNHYPMTYGHEWNWAILAAISLIGASVRHFFNVRGQGHKTVWLLPTAAMALVALAWVSSKRHVTHDADVSFAAVQDIVERRCVECHSAAPTSELYDVAPQGVTFDTPKQIQDHAARIHAQSVATQQMPLSNLTNMSDEERAIVGAWYQQGARLE